jgi:2,3-bisphosphoglycerate-dependent phosphoglycerate mutase
MKLFIIRHAQSVNNVLAEAVPYNDYMSQRVPEPPITQLGFQQAELVARHIANEDQACEDQQVAGNGYGFTRLLVSPMLRTLQTAWPLSQALGLAPEVWVTIHEQGGMFAGNPHQGAVTNFSGLTRSEMLANFPGVQLPSEVTEQGWWFGGYEEMAACVARAVQAAQTLRQWAPTMPDARIALVSHGTFADALIKSLCQLPNEHPIYFSHYNTAITRLDFLAEGYIALRYTNRTQHLKQGLLTR